MFWLQVVQHRQRISKGLISPHRQYKQLRNQESMMSIKQTNPWSSLVVWVQKSQITMIFFMMELKSFIVQQDQYHSLRKVSLPAISRENRQIGLKRFVSQILSSWMLLSLSKKLQKVSVKGTSAKVKADFMENTFEESKSLKAQLKLLLCFSEL